VIWLTDDLRSITDMRTDFASAVSRFKSRSLKENDEIGFVSVAVVVIDLRLVLGLYDSSRSETT
jgi:hypothetical protein